MSPSQREQRDRLQSQRQVPQPMGKFCLCGVPCERFEVWIPETTDAGREHFGMEPGEERYGIHAIVNREGHCSAFEGRKYHLTKEQAQAMCDDFNSRAFCDLGIEAGVL